MSDTSFVTHSYVDEQVLQLQVSTSDQVLMLQKVFRSELVLPNQLLPSDLCRVRSFEERIQELYAMMQADTSRELRTYVDAQVSMIQTTHSQFVCGDVGLCGVLGMAFAKWQLLGNARMQWALRFSQISKGW